jgi:hypothetical protein
MNRNLSVVAASCASIFAVIACNIGFQNNASPDYPATITAQAQQIAGAPTQPAAATAQPADTQAAVNTQAPPPPPDTPKPATPSKPKNFKANGAASSITFSWDDTSLDEDGFRIYQDGVTAPIASLDAHSATGGMSYNFGGLACGFKGSFKVRAFNQNGESGGSNSEDGVTIPCTPTNLIATGQESTISFNWAVSNPHNEDGFRIYAEGNPQPVASRGPNKGSGGTIYDLNGLHCDTIASYSVVAFNKAGESGKSNLFQAETVPCNPTNFTITGTDKDTVTYTWNDNSNTETGFHIYQNDILYATVSAHLGTGTMANDAFQICGKTMTYAIRAFNYAGESGWSEHQGATTLSC